MGLIQNEKPKHKNNLTKDKPAIARDSCLLFKGCMLYISTSNLHYLNIVINITFSLKQTTQNSGTEMGVFQVTQNGIII